MTETGGATAHRELLSQVRELLKAVRVMKNQLAPQTTAVPPGTLGILAAIAAVPGSHVKTLAADSALDPSTVSRAVAALVRTGLVERAADPDDGRASVLAVSEYGQAALAQVEECHYRRLAGALTDWTPEELHVLTGLLQRFTDDLLTTTQTPTLLEAAR